MGISGFSHISQYLLETHEIKCETREISAKALLRFASLVPRSFGGFAASRSRWSLSRFAPFSAISHHPSLPAQRQPRPRTLASTPVLLQLVACCLPSLSTVRGGVRRRIAHFFVEILRHHFAESPVEISGFSRPSINLALFWRRALFGRLREVYVESRR